MSRYRQIIGKLFRIFLFLSAMFLLVMRSIEYTFYPTDYKHVFLTAAVLGLLFLFFKAQVRLKLIAKIFLAISFISTIVLIYLIPRWKVTFDYTLAVKDDFGEIRIETSGLDDEDTVTFTSKLPVDDYMGFEVLDKDNNELEYSIIENEDPLRLVNYSIQIQNQKKDIIIRYKMKHRPLYLNDVFIFPRSDVFHVGKFRMRDESDKFNIYTEFPLMGREYNLSSYSLKDLRYSLILIDEGLQITGIDDKGRWRLVCKEEYVRDNLLAFLNKTRINMKELYGFSFSLDVLVGEYLPTGKHKKRRNREIIASQPKDLEKFEVILHELFHCYHAGLWYNPINEGIIEFLTYTYAKEYGMLSEEEFNDKICEYYAEYYNFPYALERSLSDIKELGLGWLNYELQYSKGFLISLMIDKRMKGTGKNLSFFDFLTKHISRKKYVDENKLISMLNRYSGHNFKDLLNEYIKGTGKIELEDCIDGSKFRVIREPSCVTFLGIRGRRKAMKSVEVTDILPNSPFFEEDLVVGDEITEWGVEREGVDESRAGKAVILEDVERYGNCFWTGIWGRDDLLFFQVKRGKEKRKIVVKPACVPGRRLSIERVGD